jgi:predicted  nucleic acid-binding Zn-ribbon protein
MRGGRDKSQDFVLGEILNHVKHLRNEVAEIRREQGIMQQQVQEALASLQTEVAAIRDTEQSAVTLITGLQSQLADALNSSNDATEVVAAVAAITEQLSTDAASLAAAVSANTPASPAPVEESPVETPPAGGDATDPTA